MARIELYKVFKALRVSSWAIGNTRVILARVPDDDLQDGNYGNLNIVKAKKEIEKAIEKLEIAKQILTKE